MKNLKIIEIFIEKGEKVFIPYFRTPYSNSDIISYNYRIGDKIDKNLLNSIKEIYPASKLIKNVLVNYETYENLLESIKSNIKVQIDIQFYLFNSNENKVEQVKWFGNVHLIFKKKSTESHFFRCAVSSNLFKEISQIRQNF